MDFSLWSQGEDPYRVAVYHRYAGLLNAVGNWWIRENQDADSAGIMTIASDTGIENEPPPDALNGEFESPGVKYERNYSIRQAGGTIQFSPPPTGSAPDCGVEP